MRIVEIQALSNGAHRNQNGFSGILPEGWAVILPGTEMENFPFGTVEAEEIDGMMTMTVWTPGVKPEPEPEPEPAPSTEERIAALEEELAAAKILLGLEE